MVMSEIELKRNVALQAEDQLKELQQLLEELTAWCEGLDKQLAADPVRYRNMVFANTNTLSLQVSSSRPSLPSPVYLERLS